MGMGRGGMDWETRTDIHTGPCMKQKLVRPALAQGAQLDAL